MEIKTGGRQRQLPCKQSGLLSSITPKQPVQHRCVGIQRCLGQGEARAHLPALTTQIIPCHPAQLEPGSHTKPKTAVRAVVRDELGMLLLPSVPILSAASRGSNLCTRRGATRRISQRLEICRSATKLQEWGMRSSVFCSSTGRKTTTELCVWTLALPTQIHPLPSQQAQPASVPRPPPPSSHPTQGCKARMVLSPGPTQCHPAQESHPLCLWSIRQVAPLPPCFLQLVEGVRGVVTGRAKAEDLVVLLQSGLPAFSAAVCHLQWGEQHPALATAAGKGGS